MKKPSLEMLRLTSGEVLQRSEMKKITGGYGNCSVCYFYDSSGNVTETLNSAGSCQAGGVCFNTSSFITWSCH